MDNVKLAVIFVFKLFSDESVHISAMRSEGLFVCLFCFCRDSRQWARASQFTRFLDHNDTPQSVGLLWTSDRTRRRDLYLTTHNTHNTQTSMPRAGFEPAISAGERLQTYALDRAATGTGAGLVTNSGQEEKGSPVCVRACVSACYRL